MRSKPEFCEVPSMSRKPSLFMVWSSRRYPNVPASVVWVSPYHVWLKKVWSEPYVVREKKFFSPSAGMGVERKLTAPPVVCGPYFT